MNWDRLISFLSLLIAITALFVAFGVGRPTPFGKSFDEYDFSNPQAALISLQDMARTENIIAGAAYFLGLLAIDDKDGTLSFFADDVTDIKFVNSFEISNSGYDSNNGKIASFVEYKVKGIEYRQVYYFVEHNGKFYLAGDYLYPIEPSRTEADKRINAAIEKFKQPGNVE